MLKQNVGGICDHEVGTGKTLIMSLAAQEMVTNQIVNKERFRYFIKVLELAAFYNEITDYRTAEDVGVDRPNKNATTGGEYLPLGELYGFPILVKTEASIREGVEVRQNRFFIEGAYKYNYNNGQIAMADHKAAATNFLNALERIPKMIEQYQTQNASIEKDLPTLRELVGGV